MLPASEAFRFVIVIIIITVKMANFMCSKHNKTKTRNTLCGTRQLSIAVLHLLR